MKRNNHSEVGHFETIISLVSFCPIFEKYLLKTSAVSLKRNRAEFDEETNCLDRILKYVTW